MVEYEVGAVIGAAWARGGYYALVKWLRYDFMMSTWEPVSNLRRARGPLNECYREYGEMALCRPRDELGRFTVIRPAFKMVRNFTGPYSSATARNFFAIRKTFAAAAA
ncbi:hypothetical protein BV898_01029 [Hypsibius exemplaris]|uniref:Chromo domain-containing protein n=1 Tax=Hypsibius exemplaris TaxID=2072580 RepID=A0A1W0XD29_HYPEX|nr:hypothetical protein BV898_01029 [Hypsibius exemplaris]